eukprot:2254819-Prymnesium_polylepis.2
MAPHLGTESTPMYHYPIGAGRIRERRHFPVSDASNQAKPARSPTWHPTGRKRQSYTRRKSRGTRSPSSVDDRTPV